MRRARIVSVHPALVVSGWRRVAGRALAGLGAACLALLAPAADVAAQSYRYPLPADKGTPTAYFDHSGKDWNCGTKRYTGHKGNDFGASKGTPIYAGADGEVVATNDGCFDGCTSGACGCGGWGNYAAVRHADNRTTYYAHMETGSVAVTKGQKVSCGDLLGKVASSGNSTGNHLHFEVRTGSTSTTSIDPFSGPCSGPVSSWVNQGPYLGRPGIECQSAVKPDAAPPKPDMAPKPDLAPKPDSKPPPDAKQPDVPYPDISPGDLEQPPREDGLLVVSEAGPPDHDSPGGASRLHGGCGCRLAPVALDGNAPAREAPVGEALLFLLGLGLVVVLRRA